MRGGWGGMGWDGVGWVGGWVGYFWSWQSYEKVDRIPIGKFIAEKNKLDTRT